MLISIIYEEFQLKIDKQKPPIMELNKEKSTWIESISEEDI